VDGAGFKEKEKEKKKNCEREQNRRGNLFEEKKQKSWWSKPLRAAKPQTIPLGLGS
jgi:hypothetical protein